MVEKLASTEIAQSRFDPFHELIIRHDGGEFGKPTSWQAMCGMLAEAERDTRERCAQLLEAEMIKVAQSENVLPAPTPIKNAEHFACIGAVGALKRMAERIRGKV